LLEQTGAEAAQHKAKQGTRHYDTWEQKILGTFLENDTILIIVLCREFTTNDLMERENGIYWRVE
jgi:hypothetical protein